MSKDLYDIHVNNKIIVRDVSQAHIRGVIYGLYLDQLKYMSDDALRKMIVNTSEMIEEGVDKPTNSTLLTEMRIRKFCMDKDRDSLLQHMSEWFLKAEGYSIHIGR